MLGCQACLSPRIFDRAKWNIWGMGRDAVRVLDILSPFDLRKKSIAQKSAENACVASYIHCDNYSAIVQM